MNKSVFGVIVMIAIAIVSFTFSNNNNNNTENVTNVTEIEKWETKSIYDIKIVDGIYTFNDKECLCSYPLDSAIHTIIDTDNVAFGDYDIEVKYIPEEDIYIANLIDNFVVVW